MMAMDGTGRARMSASSLQPAIEALSRPAEPPSLWRLTRRLASTGRLTLFRAAATGDRGPGCYVFKTTPRIRPGDDISGALLFRESAVAAAVNHGSLASVVAADLHGSRPHLILPYLEGVTLRRLLCSLTGAKHGMSPCHALSIARQVAAALAAMHEAGWLHSQVRPEHIIVSPLGHATLIDLTQARRLASGECDADGVLPPAPHYAAPEFFARRHVTSASDIYALGVALFESLTGRLPFSASSPHELASCHRQQAPPNVRDSRTDLSWEVAELLGRMMAKEPLRRPSDQQLVRWLAELEIEALA